MYIYLSLHENKNPNEYSMLSAFYKLNAIRIRKIVCILHSYPACYPNATCECYTHVNPWPNPAFQSHSDHSDLSIYIVCDSKTFASRVISSPSKIDRAYQSTMSVCPSVCLSVEKGGPLVLKNWIQVVLKGS